MRYSAGQLVGRGTYWSLGTGDQMRVREGQAILPGPTGTRFLRIPGAAMIALGPLLGLLFVVFLPVIGIVLTARVVAIAIGRRLSALAWSLSHLAAAPDPLGQAALTRKSPDDTEPEGDAEVKRLADEVAARRDRGEK